MADKQAGGDVKLQFTGVWAKDYVGKSGVHYMTFFCVGGSEITLADAAGVLANLTMLARYEIVATVRVERYGASTSIKVVQAQARAL